MLLHESVAVNVTLGDPTLGLDAVRSTLEAANAWDFVSAMPEGVDTTVGERGVGDVGRTATADRDRDARSRTIPSC